MWVDKIDFPSNSISRLSWVHSIVALPRVALAYISTIGFSTMVGERAVDMEYRLCSWFSVWQRPTNST